MNTKEWTVQDDEMLEAPIILYEAPKLTAREILDTFMPDCLPVIKKNITLLKKKKKELHAVCSPVLDLALEGIYMHKWPGDSAEWIETRNNLLWVPLARTYFYDRHIDPIDDKIKELEQLLKMSQIQQIDSPKAHLDLDRAKQYPLTNLVKVNHAGFTACPFHKEKTASMKIYKDNRFHCFGCGKDGDVIDFVMHRDNVDFKTAVTILNQ